MSDLLTYREAATYCRLGKSAFYAHVRPHLRVTRVGSAVRFRTADLDRYLDAAHG